MTCTPSPFPLAVLAEATRISPARRTSSDGICGDAAHQAEGAASDHNPDARGIPHAVDISHSMPGAPFWTPGLGEFDAHAHGEQIAHRIVAGTEKRVKYLVSHNYITGSAKIFDPNIGSLVWRDQSGDNHASHLHVSFLSVPWVEQSTAQFLQPTADPGVTMTWLAPVSDPASDGYWCVNDIGQVYAYGAAKYHGGKDHMPVPNAQFNGKVVGLTPTADGGGYWMLTDKGSIYAFGGAPNFGDPHP